MRSILIGVWLAFALIASAMAAPNDAGDLAARAKALVDRRLASEAFLLLDPYEPRFAGDVDFDYWLGVSALESDRLDRALIAFERVLVRNPGFDSARLELARTYLRMGALDVASQEFDRLLARAPTSDGRKLIEEYRAQIERLRRRQRLAVNGYVEAGGGRDTNLSSSTNDFPGAILGSFGLPGIQPTGNSIRREDNFAAASAGGDVYYALAPDRSAFAAANLRWRGYRNFNEYDYVFGDVVGGYRARARGIDWTASAIFQAFRQDGAFVDTLGAERVTNDRDAAGASLEARQDAGPNTQVALGVQYTVYRYRTNPGQDTRQFAMTLAIESKPAVLDGATIAVRGFYSQDEARRALNDFTSTTASRHALGVRVIAQTDPSAQLSWQKALAWSRRIDDDAFARATLVSTGRDDLLEAFVRASYRLPRGFAIQPYVSWIYNRSNIALYAFHKTEGGVMLRYETR